MWERQRVFTSIPGAAGDSMIRAARSDEILLLQTLEQAAGAPFRE
jgi:hypothetical protein